MVLFFFLGGSCWFGTAFKTSPQSNIAACQGFCLIHQIWGEHQFQKCPNPEPPHTHKISLAIYKPSCRSPRLAFVIYIHIIYIYFIYANFDSWVVVCHSKVASVYANPCPPHLPLPLCQARAPLLHRKSTTIICITISAPDVSSLLPDFAKFCGVVAFNVPSILLGTHQQNLQLVGAAHLPAQRTWNFAPRRTLTYPAIHKFKHNPKPRPQLRILRE
jgi:hypothetical protein